MRIGAHGMEEGYRCGLIPKEIYLKHTVVKKPKCPVNKDAPYNNRKIVYNKNTQKYEYEKKKKLI